MRRDQETRGRAKSPGRARSAIRHFRTEPSSAPFDMGPRPETLNPKASEPAGFAAAANRTKRLCFGYGFRFVNGRLVASRQVHCGDWAPCTSFAPIVQHPTPSIWLHLGAAGRTVRCSRCKEVWLARPEDAVDVDAAGTCHGGGRATPAANADAAAEWEALARAGRRRGSKPRRRQPLDIGRLAGRRTKRSRPLERRLAVDRPDDTDDAEAARRTHAWFQQLAAAAAASPVPASHSSACPRPAPRWARWCWR